MIGFQADRCEGVEFVCGNLSGDPGGSLSVNMDSGVWKDFSTDEGGKDPVSLFAAIHGLKQGEAARRLSEHLRLDQGNASSSAGRKAQDKSRMDAHYPGSPGCARAHCNSILGLANSQQSGAITYRMGGLSAASAASIRPMEKKRSCPRFTPRARTGGVHGGG